jgi:hypothetical protein
MILRAGFPGVFARYFDYNYDGPPFELFGTGHLLAVTIILAVVAFLVFGWRSPTEACTP